MPFCLSYVKRALGLARPAIHENRLKSEVEKVRYLKQFLGQKVSPGGFFNNWWRHAVLTLFNQNIKTKQMLLLRASEGLLITSNNGLDNITIGNYRSD